MKKSYENYEIITKELLDSVQVGDLIKFNDWQSPLRVKGVSENYFVMSRKMFGQKVYSICEKKPWDGVRYNSMRGGMFHISTDSWLFGWGGWPKGHEYDFEDEEAVKSYLQSLERGETEISQRRACPVEFMSIKRGG